MSNVQETKTEEKTSTGRYSVGQKIYGVCFHENGKPPMFGGGRPFLFGKEDYPTLIDIVELTVTEHHKVAWDQDPKDEKKYDGYLLKDNKGQVWCNQYPRASYGQISDAADREFSLYTTDEKEMEKWLDSDETTMCTLLVFFYEDLTRGVASHENLKNREETEKGKNTASFDKKLELMKRLQKDLQDKMKNDFGLVFKSVPFVKEYPDITKSILVKES
jgi:hypothetical protein